MSAFPLRGYIDETYSAALKEQNARLQKVWRSHVKGNTEAHGDKGVLDGYIIGQENTKITLSVAVYNHYKRIIHGFSNNDDVELQKSNIRLLAPPAAENHVCANTGKVSSGSLAIADATTPHRGRLWVMMERTFYQAFAGGGF